MHVAQALLEPKHLFADDLEAEMARLDDPGVHRTDGNLVDAVALDAHERIRVVGRTSPSVGATKSRCSGNVSAGQLAWRSQRR